MKKNIYYLFLLLSSNYSFAQNWTLVTESEAYPTARTEYQNKRNQKIFKLDRKTLDQKLVNVTSRNTNQVGTIISMPNDKGVVERFEVWEASNFSAKDQAKYPNLRSYVGKSIEDPSAYLRFSTGPSGISSTIFRAHDKSEFLETYSSDGKFFEVHSKNAKNDFNCSTPEEHANHQLAERIETKNNDQKFRTYRLALSVTGEYSQTFGGTLEKSLEAMNNTMTRVNGIFEKDMAVNFIFADDIEKLVYLDPKTDPYSPAREGLSNDSIYGTSPNYASVWNVELQRNLRDNFGEDKYDIGHLFGHEGGGGNAGCIGCICETDFPLGKGSGFTSPGNGLPKGDSFDVDYVAHEIGHQLGANHTFSHRYESSGVLVEPGGGSTIMGYAGITYYNIQAHSDDYFAHSSIRQVKDNLSTKTCGISRPILNTAPKIELKETTYYIPVETAFKLDAKVTDDENDAILVNWEQNNSGTYTTTNSYSRVRTNKTIGPNFRSYQPVKETYRYFPKFESILENKLTRDVFDEQPPKLNEIYSTIVGESLTSVPRKYDFTVTARDYNPEGPQNNYAQVKVTATPSVGPFVITSPEKLVINTNEFTVTWDVANTDIAPVNTTKVKVSISWDGGKSFKELGIVDNNGSATFKMPEDAVSVTKGYIMIEAIDNIFLAVKKFETELLATNDLVKNESKIYPNPSNGTFTIEQKITGQVKINVIDINGRIVYSTNTNATGNFKKEINTNLTSGVYFVQVSSNEGENTSKLIIK
ncbi:zinc-dependent metalloprotease [Empedobacter brevis]|uniref:zinc-dependent metalloprotease n=1 Tax=Empedobacter brevis TaxID=247 RepID=UPI0039B0D841